MGDVFLAYNSNNRQDGISLGIAPIDVPMLDLDGGNWPIFKLEMVNGFFSVDLGTIYSSESPVKPAEKELLAFIRKETNRTYRGVFCSVRLFVAE